MSFSIRVIYFLFFLTCLTTSCVDVIEFERPSSYDDAITIHGKLLKGDPSIVEVRTQAAFNLTNFAPSIPMEEVLLVDEEGNTISLAVRQTGSYRAEISIDHPTMKIEYGRKYKIQMTAKDGEEYESDFDQLLAGIKPDSLTTRNIEVDGAGRGEFEIVTREAIGFNIYTPTKASGSDETARFLWEIMPTYKITDTPELYSGFACCGIRKDREAKTCYASFFPTNYRFVYNASTSTRGQLDSLQIYRQVPYHIFAEGYYLTVFQQVLSPEAFKYWSQLDLLVNPRGDVFREPAGRIITNIESKTDPDKEIYGYFYAAEQHVIRVYVSPEFAGNPDRFCPPPAAPGCAPPICCNCESVENSTSVKPEWWVE